MESIAPTDGPYVVFEGKKLLDFSSCDFLGLAQHPEVKKGAIKYALKYGVAATTRSSPQLEVESKLAHYLGKECALLLSSESELASLKKAKSADITYYLGMVGSNGFGSSKDAEIVYGALLFGAATFIAGPKKQLSAFQPGKISFPSLGAIDCALSFIPEMEQERKMVQKYKSWLVKLLGDFSIEEQKYPRVNLTTSDAEGVRQFFLEEQIYLAPSSDTTLSFGVTALHTPDDLDQLTDAVKKFSTTDLALAMQSLTPTP